MLYIIYTVLNVSTLLLTIIYLVFLTVIMIRKSNNRIANIKVQILFTLILFVLKIVMMIPAVMLGKSIGYEIFCAVLWGLCIILGFLTLKRVKKNTLDIEVFIDVEPYSESKEDMIDVDFTDVHYIEQNEE